MLTTEIRNGALWLRINRPEKHNALTPPLVQGLLDGLARAEAEPTAHSVVITGTGRSFCAGADLDFFLSCVRAPDGLDQFVGGVVGPLATLLRRIRESPLPVIGALNGPVVAGGLELAVGLDLLIASSTATFADAHSLRGLAPAVGGAFGLAAAVGAQFAARMLFLGDACDADSAHRQGLVAEVTAPEDLEKRVGEITSMLAERSAVSLAQLKRQIRRATVPDWDQWMAADLADFESAWGNPDMAEGIAAFVERRPSQFPARTTSDPAGCVSEGSTLVS